MKPPIVATVMLFFAGVMFWTTPKHHEAPPANIGVAAGAFPTIARALALDDSHFHGVQLSLGDQHGLPTIKVSPLPTTFHIEHTELESVTRYIRARKESDFFV